MVLERSLRDLPFEFDKSTLVSLSTVCRVLESYTAPLLYRDVLINRSDAYFPLFNGVVFNVIPPSEISNQAQRPVLVLFNSYLTKRNHVSKFIKTLTCTAPPPSDLISLLENNGHSALFLEPHNPFHERTYRSTHSTLALHSLTIHIFSDELQKYFAVTRLLHATTLTIINSQPYASIWTSSKPIVSSHWINLKEITLENCIIIRKVSEAVGFGIGLTYRSHPNLETIRINLTRWDLKNHPLMSNTYSSPVQARPLFSTEVFRAIPDDAEFPNFRDFIISVTSKKRMQDLISNFEICKESWSLRKGFNVVNSVEFRLLAEDDPEVYSH